MKKVAYKAPKGWLDVWASLNDDHRKSIVVRLDKNDHAASRATTDAIRTKMENFLSSFLDDNPEASDSAKHYLLNAETEELQSGLNVLCLWFDLHVVGFSDVRRYWLY